MGFDDNLSLTASKKYGKNIDAAVNYIIAQQNTSKHQHHTQITSSSSSLSVVVAGTQERGPFNNLRYPRSQ